MNAIRWSLLSGEPALGGWLSLGHPLAAEVMAKAGCRWAIIDTQHGTTAPTDLLSLLQALELGGADGLVRIPWPDEASVMKALDCGAVGIVIPMVNTRADAERMAKAMRYAPTGIRSFGPIRSRYKTPADANADVLCLPMIETAEGLDNARDIVGVSGVDGLFLGPVDLALSVGLTRDDGLNGHPLIAAAVRDLVKIACQSGKFVGTVAFSESQSEAFLEAGVQLLTLNSDRTHLTRGIAQDVEAFQRLATRFRQPQG